MLKRMRQRQDLYRLSDTACNIDSCGANEPLALLGPRLRSNGPGP